VSAIAVVARTSLLRASRRPSTWALGAVAFAPAVLGAAMGAAGYGALSVAAPLAAWIAAPLLAVALVAGTLGESFERRTMVYWFTRPVPRSSVIFGEFLANATLCAVILGLAGMCLAMVHAATGDATVGALLRLPAALALEGVGLAGLALGVGVLAPKHPVFVAAAILMVLEGALPNLVAVTKYTSLFAHVGWLAGAEGMVTEAATGTAAAPPWPASLLVVALYAALPTLLAARVATERDLG
jgi:hypothetical protein